MDEYHYRKDQLTKAFSYPIKRSELDNFMEHGKFTTLVKSIRYSLTQPGYRNKTFWHSEENQVMGITIGYCSDMIASYFSDVDLAAIVSIAFSIQAVPSDKRNLIRQILFNEGLPLIEKWLLKAEFLLKQWDRGGYHLDVKYKDDNLYIVESNSELGTVLFEKTFKITLEPPAS